ncbi:hypothetical protein [Macrococcoides canis]|uniref:hypothetical protein n=1 Tax=Macrococcoides canis TaxID=1855823 RepID=UPI001B8BE6C0|nr:hypothetical protein [Macrococcus canis]QUR94342.1 hypothetical protein GOY09_04955 [Macrococcus canis]
MLDKELLIMPKGFIKVKAPYLLNKRLNDVRPTRLIYTKSKYKGLGYDKGLYTIHPIVKILALLQASIWLTPAIVIHIVYTMICYNAFGLTPNEYGENMFTYYKWDTVAIIYLTFGLPGWFYIKSYMAWYNMNNIANRMQLNRKTLEALHENPNSEKAKLLDEMRMKHNKYILFPSKFELHFTKNARHNKYMAPYTSRHNHFQSIDIEIIKREHEAAKEIERIKRNNEYQNMKKRYRMRCDKSIKNII